MKNSWSRQTEAILSEGRSLIDIGICNWAFTKTAALTAIRQFASCSIPILGGDVYEIIDGSPKPNYDNWYCDPLAGETDIDFLNRSVTKAENYIKAYQDEESDKVLFVLVPKN